jgi:hypothetical protein
MGMPYFVQVSPKEANECTVTPAIMGIFAANFANVKRIFAS